MSKKPILLPLHYDSIDVLPMLNWDKINKKNDLTYLLFKPSKLNEKQIAELQKVWKKIYDEFINEFGFGDHFKSIMDLEIKIARLKLKKIIKNDQSIQNFINANEKMLFELKNKNVGGDVYDTKMAIEKKLGIRISLGDCTVMEFYKYLNSLKKQ
jgi:hypothetical protein